MIVCLKSGFSIWLEFLTEDEVEVRASALTEHGIETVGPVDTHHTHHRKEDTNTGTGATLEAERIHVLDCCPCVTALQEGKTVDGGLSLEQVGEMKLDTHACIGVALAAPRCEGAVVVTAQTDCFRGIGV